jgi:signal peptidase II
MRLLFWTGFWVFLADQATKYFVVHWLGLISKDDKLIAVMPPYLEFRMAWNKGVNFGLLANFDMRWVLIAVSMAISVAVAVWLWRRDGKTATFVAGGLLIGGALGNVVDRLLYGAVADFLNMSCCGIDNPYSFNLADVAIFLGAVGLAFLPEGKVVAPPRK